MFKKKFLILGLLFISTLFAVNESVATSDQELLNNLNEEIIELEDQRDKLSARAARLNDMGDRLQFESGSLGDARRYWNMAQKSNEIADKIDVEIDKLKIEKQQLLHEMGKEGEGE
ncbi:MAG: hypothetical protein P0S95_03250 [Rhabdochlamydiaceae bacterium]|nr:hypothetical protein [Candidatus Amphrikana amoebophyrae]